MVKENQKEVNLSAKEPEQSEWVIQIRSKIKIRMKSEWRLDISLLISLLSLLISLLSLLNSLLSSLLSVLISLLSVLNLLISLLSLLSSLLSLLSSLLSLMQLLGFMQLCLACTLQLSALAAPAALEVASRQHPLLPGSDSCSSSACSSCSLQLSAQAALAAPAAL